jgi:hypothetical protein
MARIHPKDSDVYVDEFDFGGVVNSAKISVDVPPGDVTSFSDVHKTYVEGKPGFTIDLNGLWSSSSPAYDAEMFIDLTSEERNVGIYPNQSTAGQFGYEGKTNISKDAIPTPVGAVIALNVTWRGDRPLIRSQLLHKVTAIASTANGTAYQHGAVAATQSVWSIVRLLAAPGGSGSNDLVITIQSDNAEGMSSPSTRLTHTTINQSSVALHETKEASGAVTDDWWRAVMTISGGGSRTFSLVIAMGIKTTDG